MSQNSDRYRNADGSSAIITQSTLAYDLGYIGRVEKETINGYPWITIDVDPARSLALEEAKRVRDVLTTLIGDGDASG